MGKNRPKNACCTVLSMFFLYNTFFFVEAKDRPNQSNAIFDFDRKAMKFQGKYA